MSSNTLAFYAQFVASKVGANSLTVTWDIEQITRADGTRSALVTAGATNITIGRRGLYGYYLAAANLETYDYIATAITSDTTVDQKEVAAVWTEWGLPSVAQTGDNFARLGAAGAGLTAVQLAAAGVDAILDEPVEGTLTLRQILMLLKAAMAGKSSGGGTATLKFQDHADSKARITATVDNLGDRTAVTLDVTP
jgi:hypothetical protein